jgi:hypothetical protein
MTLVGRRFPAYSNVDIGQLETWAESYLLKLLTLYSIAEAARLLRLQNIVR